MSFWQNKLLQWHLPAVGTECCSFAQTLNLKLYSPGSILRTGKMKKTVTRQQMTRVIAIMSSISSTLNFDNWPMKEGNTHIW